MVPWKGFEQSSDEVRIMLRKDQAARGAELKWPRVISQMQISSSTSLQTSLQPRWSWTTCLPSWHQDPSHCLPEPSLLTGERWVGGEAIRGYVQGRVNRF